MTDSPNLTLFRRALDATGAGDADALTRLFADDFVLELPYYGAGVIAKGQEAHDFIKATFDFVRFSVTILEVHPSADPDLIIVEYVSDGVFLETQVPYRNRYVGFWWFRNGQVCRVREFYNPSAANEADGPTAPSTGREAEVIPKV